MRTNFIRAAIVLAATWAAIDSQAEAQFFTRTIPSAQQLNPPNQYYIVAPGLTQTQYLNNIAQTARALNGISPYQGQLNPFIQSPQVVLPSYNPAMFPPVSPYGVNPYTNPYASGAYANPYTTSTTGLPTTNPYSTGTASSTYSPYDTPQSAYNPYTPYPSYTDQGAGLKGQADVMRAYSSVVMANEQARITREQANQAKLETRKKQFDLDMYIKANTPSYNDEQAKLAMNTLKRIQTNSNPAEITSGKALNYLLDDVRKHGIAKSSIEPIMLDDAIVQRLNVTGSFGNVGLLRNEGKVNWPIALQEMLTPEQQKELDQYTQTLYKNAVAGKVNGPMLKEVATQMENVRGTLLKKVNDIPTGQYLEAKRFITDFNDALTGIERGDLPVQLEFQKFFRGPKTAQDLAAYMVRNGLKFAPASPGDESAYQSVYAAMVSYDVALNSQSPSVADAKDYP